MTTAVELPEAIDRETLNVDDFLQLEFDERVELVDGEIKTMSRNNIIHGSLIIWLGRILDEWAASANWGIIAGGDAGVQTKKDPDTVRGADVACISFERYQKVSQKGKVFDVGPELIIEVISPSNTWIEIDDKIAEYFGVGTDEVWVINPGQRSVTIYRLDGEIQRSAPPSEEVVTSAILPGFELSLTEMSRRIELCEEQNPEDPAE